MVGGGKGIVVFELRLEDDGARCPLEPTVILPNAGHRLVAALATFWDDEGRPAIAGLDVGARRPTEAQLAMIGGQDLQELEDIRADFEVERFLAGVEGTAAYQALTF